MTDLNIYFTLGLLVTAFLFASVGHGGATGYLALMIILGFAPLQMKSTALALNTFVASVAFFQFYHKETFSYKLFFPLAIFSIPASFFGAIIHLDDALYKQILAFCLLFAAIRLFTFGGQNIQTKKPNILILCALGTVIGFISGSIGIGGGIILSPILLLMAWASFKETAALSALFILVNSISGLLGLAYKKTVFENHIWIWAFIALLGGILGSYWGKKQKNMANLKYILILILAVAILKLIFLK